MEQQMMTDGGLQHVRQLIAVQYVYLEFNGESTSYDGRLLTIEHVEVQPSKISAERIDHIVSELNAQYAAQNVVFVTERPVSADFSAIFIGKAEASSSQGSFAGLAETIDKENKDKSDNAFVLLDASNTYQ